MRLTIVRVEKAAQFRKSGSRRVPLPERALPVADVFPEAWKVVENGSVVVLTVQPPEKKAQSTDSPAFYTSIRFTPLRGGASASPRKRIYMKLKMKLNFAPVVFAAGVSLAAGNSRADEQLFGFVRGAETLPKGRAEVYQFVTYRTGKDSGSYHAFDFDTEIEYGITDRLQASVAMVNHYINNTGVDGLDDMNKYQLGGVEFSTKYRLLSPFKDVVGLALRLEGGYLQRDEVGGLPQEEWYIAPELDLQKNFRDDTVIANLNLGAEWAWGKQPAEEYPREFSLQGGAGLAYRFAPNWFAGVETRVRSEWPMFEFDNFEHLAVFSGPSLHYSQKRWWVTLSWVYQVWGSEVDPTTVNKAYAEEVDHQVRLKVGFNF
jgi:hypothetical protein